MHLLSLKTVVNMNDLKKWYTSLLLPVHKYFSKREKTCSKCCEAEAQTCVEDTDVTGSEERFRDRRYVPEPALESVKDSAFTTARIR